MFITQKTFVTQSQYILQEEKCCLETIFSYITTNYCDQNSHQIRFLLLNNYKIKVMIEFSD